MQTEIAINHRQEDDFIIIEINGPINVNTSGNVSTYIDQTITDNNDTKLIIDLQNTPFVSSSGIRTFLSVAKKMKSQNRSLAFCSPNKTVQEVFSISGFDALVKVTQTREEALTTP